MFLDNQISFSRNCCIKTNFPKRISISLICNTKELKLLPPKKKKENLDQVELCVCVCYIHDNNITEYSRDFGNNNNTYNKMPRIRF